MKISLLQEDLSWGLGVVSRVATVRGQLPVLANVLIEAEKGGVELAATNLEMGLRAWAGGKVEMEGKITVSARSFGEFVASLRGNVVNLSEHEGKLKVDAEGVRGVFAGISAAEFPVMPRMGKDVIKFKKDLIMDMAKQVAYAAASDDSRPVLTGVQIKVVGDNLVFTATDGFRLSRKVVKNEAGDPNRGLGKELILPARTILELGRMLEMGKKGEVEMWEVKENNQVIFKYDKVEVISRILEGNFPDVDKIIPGEGKTEARVGREDLIQAVKAAAIFARENNNIIKLKITGSTMKIFAAGGGLGEGEAELGADSSGEDGEIAFNYRYVSDFLGSLSEERVVFSMSGGLAPGVWRGEKDESLIHLIMPVRV